MHEIYDKMGPKSMMAQPPITPRPQYLRHINVIFYLKVNVKGYLNREMPFKKEKNYLTGGFLYYFTG